MSSSRQQSDLKRYRLDAGRLFGVAPLVLVSAYLGLRLLHVLVNFQSYAQRLG